MQACSIRSAIANASESSAQVLAQHDEFISTEAPDRVAGAKRGAEPRGQPDQQQVADIVAAGVVDELEVVEVKEHDRERPTRAAGATEGVLKPVEEQRAVGKARQRIMAGAVGERLGCELAIGDVSDRDRDQAPLFAGQRRQRDLDRELGPVPASRPQLDRRGFARCRPLIPSASRVGIDRNQLLHRPADQLFPGAAE